MTQTPNGSPIWCSQSHFCCHTVPIKSAFAYHDLCARVWGYFEKGDNDAWKVAKNEHEVFVDVFGFMTELNICAMIPGTEIKPKVLSTSDDSSVSSSSTDSSTSPSSSIVPSAPYLASSKRQWLINSSEAPAGEFRHQVSTRDSRKCVVTGMPDDFCQASHT